MQVPSAEQPVKALRGNATFNKINKAANREMRLLHILEEKFKLKHPKSSEVKHLNVQFCTKMQLISLRDGCLHPLLSNKDCTRNEHLSLSRYTLCKCSQRNGAVLSQDSENTTPTLPLLLFKQGLQPHRQTSNLSRQCRPAHCESLTTV